MCIIPGFVINRAKYPLYHSPSYKVLLEAEEHGLFSLSVDEIIRRCQAVDSTLSDAAIMIDIDQLCHNNRIVKHGTQVLIMNTCEDEQALAKHLITLLKDNGSSVPNYFGPFPIESKLADDHPMKKVVEDAALVHLTHKLSIAITDSTQEMKWLARTLQIETGHITPRCMNAVCAVTERSADLIFKNMRWNIYDLPTVLHSKVPIDEEGYGYHKTRAMWRSTTVILNEDSFFTPSALLELLKNEEFGRKVILVAERGLLDKDAAGLLNDLIHLGFPTTFVGEGEAPVMNSDREETYLVMQTKKLITEEIS